MAERLGEVLIKLGALRPEDLERALRTQRELGKRLGETLLHLGFVDEDTVLKALARQRRITFAEARWFENLENRLIRLVPRQRAIRGRLVPLRLMDKKLVIATCDADNLDRLDDVAAELGHPLKPVLARRADIERALARYYQAGLGDGITDEVQLLVRKKDPGSNSSARIPAVVAGKQSGSFRAVPGTNPGSSPGMALPPSLQSNPTDPQPREVPVALRPPPLISASDDAELRELFASRDSVEATAELGETDEQTSVNAAAAADEPGTQTDMAAVEDDHGFDAESATPPPPVPPRAPAPPPVRPRNPAPRVARLLDQKSGPRITPSPQAAAPVPSAEDPDAGPTRLPFKPQRPTTFVGPPPPPPPTPKTPAPPPPPPPPRVASPAPPTGSDGIEVMEEAAADAPVEGTQFGPYTLIRRVKAGGMAEVFLAKSGGVEGFEKQVAIKRILPHLTDSSEFVEMFIDEAKLTVQLNHANIAHIYDFGKRDGSYYIAMEFIHGRDVNALFKDGFKRKAPLPIPICCYIVQQICEGLDYAHRKRGADNRELGIVHRDISPANILVSFEGAVKIIDFGIAKAVSKLSMTRPGLIKGKISYMSPEQMRGQAIDRRSDVFAVGIILYELIAGRRLFAARTDVETIRNVIKGNIPPLVGVRPDVPSDLVDIVMKALEREVERRYSWAADLSADLQSFLIRHQMRDPRGELARHMATHLSGDEG
ncbi:MAG: protein kinase [Deltaproteobacteria bacterium]|nr:protein kinase [Deltaproteobacteria bacterium]